MAEQPSWQIRLEHLALTEDEKNKAEVLIPLRFTVEERVLFLRGSAEEAISRERGDEREQMMRIRAESHISFSSFLDLLPL